jgi:hypothetical protein
MLENVKPTRDFLSIKLNRKKSSAKSTSDCTQFLSVKQDEEVKSQTEDNPFEIHKDDTSNPDEESISRHEESEL